jgi:hypothetical protein
MIGPRCPRRSAMQLNRHALGTSAINMPVILAFLLLLGTRAGLPRRTETFERLNRAREKAGKSPLLEHVEVSCPLMARSDGAEVRHGMVTRRGPRLHHVRGHLGTSRQRVVLARPASAGQRANGNCACSHRHLDRRSRFGSLAAVKRMPPAAPVLAPIYALPCAFNKSASICATFFTEGRAFHRST